MPTTQNLTETPERGARAEAIVRLFSLSTFGERVTVRLSNGREASVAIADESPAALVSERLRALAQMIDNHVAA